MASRGPQPGWPPGVLGPDGLQGSSAWLQFRTTGFKSCQCGHWSDPVNRLLQGVCGEVTAAGWQAKPGPLSFLKPPLRKAKSEARPGGRLTLSLSLLLASSGESGVCGPRSHSARQTAGDGLQEACELGGQVNRNLFFHRFRGRGNGDATCRESYVEGGCLPLIPRELNGTRSGPPHATQGRCFSRE